MRCWYRFRIAFSALAATLLALLATCPSQAQVDNSGLEHRYREPRPDPLSLSPQQTLSLSLYSFSYFRNYEYFNEFADGLTYFGTQLKPELVFRPGKHVSLHGGVFLAKDFGASGFREVQPLLSVRYQKNGIGFITGAIDPHLSHRYIEPLLDYDKSITDPVEYGTQLKFDRPVHRTDIWLNWKHMIYKPSSEQEEILAGVNTSLHVLRKKEFELSIPIQVIGWHSGGQIDTTALSAKTLLNLATGIEFAWNRNGAVEKIFTKNYLLGFGNSEGDGPYEEGTGLYLNAGVETRWLDVLLSYWRGHRFVAPAGAPVFQSVSSHVDHPGLTRDNRSLLFLRLKKDFTLDDALFVSARLEPFWDFQGRYADYSVSLFVVYQGFFDLFRFSR